MQNKFLYLFLASVLLTGCATVPDEPAVEVRTVTVEIPIPVKCKAEVPPPPVYCFDSLRKSDDIYIKTRCFLSDRKKSLAYELQLLTGLESCK